MSGSGRDMEAAGVARWLESAGLPGARVEALQGGASMRRYWRAHLPATDGPGATRVVMTLPRGGPASEELGKPGASAGEDFVTMARWLAALNLPVPTLHKVDLEAGVLLLQDLGDRRLFDAIVEGGDLAGHYGPALDLLVAFQAAAQRATPDSPGHQRVCDAPVLAAELEHFLEFGIEARQGRQLDASERDALQAGFSDVVARLAAAPQALAHRDFQSQNLMITTGGLVLIDFQDAFIAPCVYDLVALLRDSYVVLPAPVLDHLLRAYHQRRVAARIPDDPLAALPTLRELFHLQTIQRKLKDAGRFEYIDKVKGNPAFLQYFSDSVAYAASALARFPEYSDTLAALRQLVPEARRG